MSTVLPEPNVENVWRRLRAMPDGAPVLDVVLAAAIEVRSAVVYATAMVSLVFLLLYRFAFDTPFRRFCVRSTGDATEPTCTTCKLVYPDATPRKVTG